MRLVMGGSCLRGWPVATDPEVRRGTGGPAHARRAAAPLVRSRERSSWHDAADFRTDPSGDLMQRPSLSRRRRRRTRGQSVVELALLLPVILLLLLGAIDFGRVYLGWINLNQMARLAANFA